MRDQVIGQAYLRTPYDIVSSGSLTLISSEIQSNDYVHTGMISFGNLFPESADSYVAIYQLIVKETITTGVLAKAPFLLYLFNDESTTTPTAGNDFDWSDLTVDLDDLAGIIEVQATDYQTIVSNSNSYDAIAIIQLDRPLIIKNNDSRLLQAIAVVQDTITFDSTADLRLFIGVEYG